MAAQVGDVMHLAARPVVLAGRLFNKSDKEKILLKIVKKLKFPKSGARNNWEFA